MPVPEGGLFEALNPCKETGSRRLKRLDALVQELDQESFAQP